MLSAIQTLAARIRGMFSRQQDDAEFSDELRQHLDLLTEENVRRGMPLAEARREAQIQLGGVMQLRETHRELTGLPFLESLFQDIRYALRMLRKSPGFTAVAVLTLALGIGANTAIFSVVRAVILMPLPYSQPNQLVTILENVHLRTYQDDQGNPSPGDFVEWREQGSVFEGIAALRDKSFNLTGSGEPVRVEGEAVSANLFTILGAHTTLGRTFTPDEDAPGGPHVALIGYGLWVSRYGADPKILSKSIRLDSVSYRVVGVMDRNFRFPDPANFHENQADQLWIPIDLTPTEFADHESHSLDGVLARLNPKITVRQAQLQMDTIAQRIAREHPNTNEGVGVRLVSLHDDLVGYAQIELWVLLAAVGLLLVMVCANLANLLLARASTRNREFAVRIALGAPKTRILRQLLTESILLALLGACAGVFLASWGLYALQNLSAMRDVGLGGLPHVGRIGIDARALIFTLAISCLAGVFFGIAPLRQVMRHSVQPTLKGGQYESPLQRVSLRDVLVAAETALGVIVIISAALLLRSFFLLEHTPLGFDTNNLLTFRVIPRGVLYSQPQRVTVFYEQALMKIQGMPGVKAAGAISFLPLSFYQTSKVYLIEGRPALAAREFPTAVYDVVSPGYFKAMGVPVLEGRDFSWADTQGTLLTVIVNRAMAQKYWPGKDTIGRRLKEGHSGETSPWLTIVGIVANYREFDVATSPQPTIFFPISQVANHGGLLRDWVVRTSASPLALASPVREAIRSIDKNIPVSRIHTMEQVRSGSIAQQQFTLVLLGLSACLALALAVVGLYGVMAYATARRSREIGIRMALGAQRNAVLRMVLREGLVRAGAGIVIGIGGALALTRFLRTLLFEVTPNDPVTFAGVAILLGLIALLACYIPARRAMRVDPMVALRYE